MMKPPTLLHVITPEYPPQIGGVSDFCRAAAERLAAGGTEVIVWAPGARGEGKAGNPGVERLPGGFGPRGLRELGRRLDARDPGPRRRLFFQWVPHGFGWHGLNAVVCLWLLWRARGRGDAVELMIHEPGVGFEGSWKQWIVAVAHRAMLATVLASAARVWLSTPAWEPRVRPYAGFNPRAPRRWLPLAMDVAVAADAGAVASLRAEFQPGNGLVLGHFGTYGRGVVALLAPALETLLARRPDLCVLLIGRGGPGYRENFLAGRPELAGRVGALGEADGRRLSLALQACDALLQPFPDGITTRRTSALACLAHGRATVSTTGHLCEETFWRDSGAVRLVAPQPPAVLADAVAGLLDDPAERAALAARGREFYREQFAACDYAALLLAGDETVA